MSRKLEMVKAAANGESPPAHVAPDKIENELDSAEKQAEILAPEITTINLIGGEKIELPAELSLDDLIRNKTLMAISFCYDYIQAELRMLRAGRKDADGALGLNVYYKPSVTAALEELLATVSKMPMASVTGRLDILNSFNLGSWMLKILQAAAPKNKTEAKADPKG